MRSDIVPGAVFPDYGLPDHHGSVLRAGIGWHMRLHSPAIAILRHCDFEEVRDRTSLDHDGKHRTLSELQGSDPLVLVLSRGGFCPKDRRQHEGLLQLHREMRS